MSGPVPVSFLPTEDLTYDPSDARYWNPSLLGKEIERAAAICHGCRMCFKYCDAFPSLFRLLDERHDGDVRALTPPERDDVLGECFQCKLCEVQCPYTPRDGHEFQLDFPRLVHRWRAVKAKEEGLGLRDRLLSDPDLLGELARASFGMANMANRCGAPRWMLEKVLGIDRRKDLPDFAGETFESWARARGRIASEPGGEAVLFHTCFVQNNAPSLGKDALQVLDRNRVDVRCAEGLACCGMPAWERGDLEGIRRRARKNLDVLLPFVDRGAKVVVVNPTCSMTMRREWPTLVEEEDRERASRLARAVTDIGEFLWKIAADGRFDTSFASSPGGTIAYHAPCHLRAQGVGFRGRDLLKKLPGVRVVSVMECCGHDGTHGMTVEGFEASIRVGTKAFDGMKTAGAPLWATDCPLAAVQFAQHAGVRPLHPVSILARAYRGEPFGEEKP